MTNSTSRAAYLGYADGTRVIAVLAVVCLHAAATGVVRYGELPELAWWTSNLVDSSCRWAVPVFLMLSGALNLDPERRESAGKFYRRRLTRVGVPLAFWSAFYFAWGATYHGRDITLELMGAELLRGLTSSHLYYLVVILGLYLVAPALRLVVQRTRPPVWWGLAACLLSLASTGVITRFMPHNAFTLFLPYLGYFLVGLALRDLVLTRHLKRLGWATFLITSVSIAAGTGALFERWGPEDYRSLALYDYLHPLVIAQSAAAFVILRSLFTTSAPQSGAGGRLLAVLGPATFGIYLGHVAILDVIRGYTGGFFARATFAVIAGDVLVAFVLSAVAALALGRIPYLRRIVG